MTGASRAFSGAWRRLFSPCSRRAALVAAPAAIALTTVPWFLQHRRAAAYQYTDEDKLRHHVYADHRLTKRELRFLEYASIEYDDVIYMSPMDFIDSLTRDTPRERVYRRVLKEKEVKKMLGKTPPMRKGGKDLFRTLDQNGLISYADYIFLVTLITKSRSSFKIAFMMFDDDDSGTVDKEEFLLIRSMMSSLRSTRNIQQKEDLLAPKRIKNNPSIHSNYQNCQLELSEFNFVVQHLNDRLFTGTDNFSIIFAKSEEEVKREDTTLLLHLFGMRGRESLSYDDFMVFHDNLQAELMEIEFREFARGKSTISPLDFAYLVLRYTVLDKPEYAEYVDRVMRKCLTDDEGISLSQWSSFSLFLNNLSQFATAVRLYTNADMPVSKAEFSRAVQCTCGEVLDPAVIDLIFAIFDANEDGKLSYREFLAVMNDRLHRGLKSRDDKGWTWRAFKSCVVHELNRP